MDEKLEIDDTKEPDAHHFIFKTKSSLTESVVHSV